MEVLLGRKKRFFGKLIWEGDPAEGDPTAVSITVHSVNNQTFTEFKYLVNFFIFLKGQQTVDAQSTPSYASDYIFLVL